VIEVDMVTTSIFLNFQIGEQIECSTCFCDTDDCNIGKCKCEDKSTTTLTTSEKPTSTEQPSTEGSTTEDPVKCDINAKCKGSPVLNYSFTNDQTECLNQCQTYASSMHQSNCKWITFDIETGLCELFEDCPSTDVGDCYSCVSSEVTCETACYIQGNCQVFYLLRYYEI
jgi:hypothetical protein